MKEQMFSPSEPAARSGSVWRSLPLEGRFAVVYEDRRGAWSNRTLDARELRLGPGRTLLGGIDVRSGLYRGFRVDRIRRLTDTASGQRAEAGILDLLLARAEAQRRAERAMRMGGSRRRAA